MHKEHTSSVYKSAINQPSTWKRIRHQFSRWSVRISFTVIAIAMVLAHLHGLEEKGLQLGLLLALILFLSEQIIEINDSVAEKVDIQINEIKNLIGNISQNLLNFVDCANDLKGSLSKICGNDKVIIEIIGINLIHAWEYFENMLIEEPNLKNVECRLLILTDDADQIGNLNDTVKGWCGDVPKMLSRINADMENIAKKAKQEERKITIEIKKYASIPTIHGLAIKQPVEAKVAYVAFCRWGGPSFENYQWGESKFYKINGYPEDGVLRDLLNIFDGHFNHFWGSSDEPYWSRKI